MSDGFGKYDVYVTAGSIARLMEVMEASVYNTIPLESTLLNCLKEL